MFAEPVAIAVLVEFAELAKPAVPERSWIDPGPQLGPESNYSKIAGTGNRTHFH